MFEKDSLTRFLEKLGSTIQPELSIYMIGGGNLSLKGLKDATKDVDFVLTSHKDLNTLKPAIEQLGYNTDEQLFNESIYQDAVIVFNDKTGSRIDIFVEVICKQLVLSEAMKKRSEEHATFENLKVMLVSNEDIFLFKSLTDRPQDIEDCAALLDAGLNWDVILDECVSQHRKDVKWVFWMYEQMCRIEDAKRITIPEKSRVFGVCIDNWGKKPSDFMCDFTKEQVRKHIPVQYQREVLESIRQ